MIAQATAGEAQARFINLDVSLLTDKWYVRVYTTNNILYHKSSRITLLVICGDSTCIQATF